MQHGKINTIRRGAVGGLLVGRRCLRNVNAGAMTTLLGTEIEKMSFQMEIITGSITGVALQTNKFAYQIQNCC
jgi:hypothetical protein